MAEERAKRKLTAILSADVKGYSRLMGQDETGTVDRIKKYRALITDLIQQYRGRVVDSPGDNILAEFASVVDATESAVKIQQELKDRNVGLPNDRKMEFRIGINLGDVIEDGERIYGDGVNIAARIQSLAEGGGICLSGTSYDQVKNKLNLVYENLGQHNVKNISEPVRVYRVMTEPETAGKVIGGKSKAKKWMALAAAVALIVAVGGAVSWFYYLRQSPKHEPASLDRMAFPLPDKPSIAVLPFDNLSEEPNQEYIADGLTENIIASLSNISEMFVIARNSTFVYKNKPVKIQQVSEELGVRYVLEGSVQKSGEKLRITAQLIDATTGYHLWADRYDRNLKDLFVLQDEITVKILTALQVQLTEGEQAHIWHTTDNLEAWGYVVKGGDLFGHFVKEDNTKARVLFERASEIDPGYALAWTMLAWTHFMDVWLGFSESPTKSINQAIELAKKSASLNKNQPELHSLWSMIYLHQRQYEMAVSAGEKAITLGPNNAIAHMLLAHTMHLAGRFEEAIGLAEKSIRLMPYCPDWFLWILAQSYRQAGRYNEAFALFIKALERSHKNKGNPMASLLGLIDVSIQLGRKEQARSYAAEVLKISPHFSLKGFREVYPYKESAHLERILTNLRKAGLPERVGSALPEKPSIAVLPFVNMSGNPDQEYLADGFTENIITALSYIPEIFVIARNSTFTYKGKAAKAQAVAEDLGVRYILEGSVQRAGERLRITAQLIEAASGRHLWADRYDRNLRDLFALQDEITLKIVFALQVKLSVGVQTRLTRKTMPNFEAWSYHVRGDGHMMRHSKVDNARAREFFEQAAVLAPEYAQVYTALGWTYWEDAFHGWSESRETSLLRAVELAEKALALDDSDPMIHGLWGAIYLQQKRYDLAIAKGEESIALGPNQAFPHFLLAMYLFHTGRYQEAVPLIKKAMRLNPYYPTFYLELLGGVYLRMEDYEEAIKAFKQLVARQPNRIVGHLGLAVAYTRLGRKEQARAEVAEVLRLNPQYSLDVYRQQAHGMDWDPDEVERDIEDLREAGL